MAFDPNPGEEQQAGIHWEALRLSAKDTLTVRASNRLKNEELLITGFAGSRLRMELDAYRCGVMNMYP